jgi:hypothetical protein
MAVSHCLYFALHITQVTQAGTWWDSLQATHRAYISTAESPDIAAFWQRNVCMLVPLY